MNNSIYWFQKAAMNGDKFAYDYMGICYELGIGITYKTNNIAFWWYQKSAEKGYVNAKFHLGYCYVNGIGTIANRKKGFELYDEAAKNISAADLFRPLESIDLNQVKYWYQQTADNDYNGVALYKLGEFYESGKGVNKNEIRAFDFYKKAAEKGNINGKYKLGYYYLNGVIVNIDKGKAFSLYKEAAEGGNKDAQNFLRY
ncbi:hypothetical protein C1645_781783 [Glomus cerebriforme]|uniref:HCP-like protein n=1 Tax=Glomus cerebriforme TaxID=658196 RepID=A0A397SN25_9GLOM|nr:hypothetical protein C1645_781783 [Glomus cerebriforme]